MFSPHTTHDTKGKGTMGVLGIMDVLINLILAIISHIPNNHIVHLKMYNFICQLYFNKAGKTPNKKRKIK